MLLRAPGPWCSGPISRASAVGHPIAPAPDADNARPFEARLDEATGLAAAIELNVVEAAIAPLATPRPSTYLGKGKVEEIKGLIAAQEIGLVVMDCALSPVQQRNLEKAWGAKVIDRTGLILEIFGRRARTREGTLQVELAHLAYQKSRLVRSWTHLERQRGGYGFLGGPGETQIEADRRLIQERMTRIEKDLEGVTPHARPAPGQPQAGALPDRRLCRLYQCGKINALQSHDAGRGHGGGHAVRAHSIPTSRAITLPHGEKAILSDTVGFILTCRPWLVAAFRATLEDVIEADILLHVRDVSHGETEAQAADGRIRAARSRDRSVRITGRIIEVWNKADLLDESERTKLATKIAPDASRATARTRLRLDGGGGGCRCSRRSKIAIARGRPSYRCSARPG